MTIKNPPSFLLNASDTSADNNNDAPRAYRDQLKPETAADILPSIIASYGMPNLNTSFDEVKVVKVFNQSSPRAGSVASLAIQNGNSKITTVNHCMAIPAPKQKKDSNSWFTPLPQQTGDNVTELEDKRLIQLSIYCFDNRDLIKTLAVGDTLRIEYINGRTEARILEKVSDNNVTEVDSGQPNAAKASENGNGETVGDNTPRKTTGGKKDDPSFATCKSPTYPNLPKKPTTFISYTKEQVIGAFNKISNDKTLKSMAFAILSMEQGNFSFPNNNVSGIQLDFGKNKGFANTTESDFDYQTCFRDNGGDQRIFAGFDTLEKGLQSFIKIIQGKINIGAFKIPTGTIQQQSSIMADNYYSSWNIAATPNELALLKSQGYFIRNGTKVARSYSKTKQIFYNTLGIFK